MSELVFSSSFDEVTRWPGTRNIMGISTNFHSSLFVNHLPINSISPGVMNCDSTTTFHGGIDLNARQTAGLWTDRDIAITGTMNFLLAPGINQCKKAASVLNVNHFAFFYIPGSSLTGFRYRQSQNTDFVQKHEPTGSAGLIVPMYTKESSELYLPGVGQFAESSYANAEYENAFGGNQVANFGPYNFSNADLMTFQDINSQLSQAAFDDFSISSNFKTNDDVESSSEDDVFNTSELYVKDGLQDGTIMHSYSYFDLQYLSWQQRSLPLTEE